MLFKDLRRGKFLTQKELAEQVGVRPGVVSEWERGSWRPNLGHLKKLCEILEVTPAEIEFPIKEKAD